MIHHLGNGYLKIIAVLVGDVVEGMSLSGRNLDVDSIILYIIKLQGLNPGIIGNVGKIIFRVDCLLDHLPVFPNKMHKKPPHL